MTDAAANTAAGSSRTERRLSVWARLARWAGTEISKALVPAVIAGVVSLTVSLVVANQQNADASSQTRAEHQRQALNELQNAVTADLQATADVTKFQHMCASSLHSWKDCAGMAPTIDVFRQQSTRLITARAKVNDQALKDWSIKFETQCIAVLDAETADASDRSFNEALDLYLNISHRIGDSLSRS